MVFPIYMESIICIESDENLFGVLLEASCVLLLEFTFEQATQLKIPKMNK